MQCAQNSPRLLIMMEKEKYPQEMRAYFLTLGYNYHLMSILEGDCRTFQSLSVTSQLKAQNMCSLVIVCLLLGQDRVLFISSWFFSCPGPSRYQLVVKEEAPISVIIHHAQWTQYLRGPSSSCLPSPGWAGSLSSMTKFISPIKNWSKFS